MTVGYLASQIANLTGKLFTKQDFSRAGVLIKRYNDVDIENALSILRGQRFPQDIASPLSFLEKIMSGAKNKDEVDILINDIKFKDLD
jgi:hypothetical protein